MQFLLPLVLQIPLTSSIGQPPFSLLLSGKFNKVTLLRHILNFSWDLPNFLNMFLIAFVKLYFVL